MGNLTGFPSLTMCHVIQDIFHGSTVWEGAGSNLSIGLFPPLTLVSVKQEDQLLLNQFALLWVCCRARGNRLRGHNSHRRLHLRFVGFACHWHFSKGGKQDSHVACSSSNER